MGTKTKKQTEKKSTLLFTKERYLFWYEKMLLMRRFEERCGQLYIQQKFGGFCHLYIGQEAILAGLVEAMDKKDRLITAYRDHVHPIALGTDPKFVMAELFGKSTGTSKGKGGSMHMFDVEKGLYGGHGIVGGQIGLGAGIAFADKYKKTGQVTYTFMGDGAVRQGILHETFNMAMMWKLPVVFIIENNYYAMGTSVARSSNVTDLFQIGHAYDMPSKAVDGMTMEEVYKAVKEAADRARKGNGPSLLEIRTYRYRGHSMSDPAKYRTKEELEAYKKEDPIEKVKTLMLQHAFVSEKKLEEIEQKIKNVVDECVQFAEESPLPDSSELYKDVYADQSYPFLPHY